MDNEGKRIGLALSGGGYRAAAYHIGTLRALHRLGILDNIDVISSVSGGSITAAYYVQHKDQGYEKIEKELTSKLRHNVLWIALIEIWIILLAVGLILYSVPMEYKGYACGAIILSFFIMWYYIFPLSKFIEWAYSLVFFKGRKLDKIPSSPVLAINSTDLSTGNLFTLSQDRMSCYPYYKNGDKFTTRGFSLARAVMASSCIPQLFSPIKISKKYRSGKFPNRPLLVDGGLYDNQGAYIFENSGNYYRVDYAIVSDAGNTTISSRLCVNPIMTLITASDILMHRIKNFQRQHNSYISEYKKKVLYVYNDLIWDDFDNFPSRFVKNIKDGFIVRKVIQSHGISDNMIDQLKNESTSEDSFREIQTQIEKNIGWENLLKNKPKRHNVAIKVCTNLMGLSKKQIDSLIEHSEWMTEVQVRLHLPFLIKNNN